MTDTTTPRRPNPAGKPRQPGADLTPIASEATLATFAHMAAVIPDAEGAGMDNMLAAILGADSWDQLDAPWSTTSTDDAIGVVVTVTDLSRRPSDFAEGLGVYLIVSGYRTETGEPITYTTGSVSVVAQLVRAYAIGALPLTTKLVKAERASANGYYPVHLQVIRHEVDTEATG